MILQNRDFWWLLPPNPKWIFIFFVKNINMGAWTNRLQKLFFFNLRKIIRDRSKGMLRTNCIYNLIWCLIRVWSDLRWILNIKKSFQRVKTICFHIDIFEELFFQNGILVETFRFSFFLQKSPEIGRNSKILSLSF